MKVYLAIKGSSKYWIDVLANALTEEKLFEKLKETAEFHELNMIWEGFNC